MPFRIFAFLSSRALGDFALDALYASSLAELFDEHELIIYYRDDRPYKKHIVRCVRNLTHVFSTSTQKQTFPIDIFDKQGGRLGIDKSMETTGVRDPDFIYVHSMFDDTMLNSIPLATLAPPAETIETSDRDLLDLGVDPEKWIVAVHWKEPGYGFRGVDPVREIANPEPYIAAIRHIIDELGGQVVRLGHPSGTALPRMKGLVDLAKIEGSEWLQLYASWISRFILSSGSGPMSYGTAFNVPTLVTDQPIHMTGLRPHDYQLPQGCVLNGKLYKGPDAVPLLRSKVDGYFKNTAEEIVAAVDEMYHSTATCLGWRSPRETPPRPQRPNAIVIPFPAAERPEVWIPPSQRVK